MPIADSWQRFHRIDDAYGLGEGLAGPASEADLDALRAIGLPVPQALIDSLRIHDGENGDGIGWLANGGELLSAAGIVEHYRMMRDTFADDVADREDVALSGIGPVRTVPMHPAWLPFADCNGEVTWFLDFDPLPGGMPGQVIRVDPEFGEWIVCANGYAEFIDAYVDALERDEVVLDDPDEDDDEAPAAGLWPPVERIPYLAPDVADAARLRELARAGKAGLALDLARRRGDVAKTDLLRFEAHAHAENRATKPALKALDALRALGAEDDDDRWLRIRVLDDGGRRDALQVELDAAIAAAPSARLHARRAEFHLDMAGRAPVDGNRAKQMKWLASPAGQQHAAVCRERAIADWRAAYALQPWQRWRLAEIDCLLDGQRWEEAEARCLQVIDVLESQAQDDPHAAQRLDEARSALERARTQDADGDDDGESMLESLDALLGLLGSDDAKHEAREMRDTFAGLLDAERDAQAARDANPDGIEDDARYVAEQIVARYGDTPERYAPFDVASLDADARRYYDGTRRELEALGFEWLADVEPLRNTETTGDAVLMRVMRSDDRTIAVAIFRFERMAGALEAVELESLLADGRVLLTDNTGAANPFAPPPSIEQQSLPRRTAAKKVVYAHRARLAAAGPARTLDDVEAVFALQERQRVEKREHARANGWISEAELRGLLGASYRELAPRVREHLKRMT